MKRVLCLMFAALFAFMGVFTSFAEGEEPEGVGEPKVENTQYALVYNPASDEVIYESKADKVIYPASTVKMMTAIIAIEYYAGRYDTRITITEEVLELTGGTKISYKLGEVLTVEQLLYGLIVGNGNDAAYALALSVCPTVEDFVALMNEKAKSLGAASTVYVNPTGVDDTKAQTTVRDVSKIAAYAASMKEYVKYSSCERYDMDATNMVGVRTIANKNWLASRSYVEKYYLPYVTGLNAGYTVKGGECCVASATKDGVSIIAVVMYAPASELPTTNYAFVDAVSMLKWAYSSYGYEKILSANEIVCEVPVELSSTLDYVSLRPAEDVYAFMPLGLDYGEAVERRYTLNKASLTAPVAEGDEVGVVNLYYEGEHIGSVPLVTKSALSKSAALTLWTWVKGLLSSLWTVILIISLLILFVLVILYNAYTRGRRRR